MMPDLDPHAEAVDHNPQPVDFDSHSFQLVVDSEIDHIRRFELLGPHLRSVLRRIVVAHI